MPDFLGLTQSDIARLLAQPSAHMRSELAVKLGSEIDNPGLSEQELKAAQDIVRVLARDIDATVRQSLAQCVRRANRLPHDVALRLAKDIDKVALPILTHSQVLTDDDLENIIRDGNPSKQEAIATRAQISEAISEALIDLANEGAVSLLISNGGARINESSLNKAVDRFSYNHVIKEKLVKRPVLPLSVTERLVTMVSENLRDYLVTHHDLPAAVASDIVMQSRERTIVRMTATSNELELDKMIAQMHRCKRLTPSLVLRALCMGDIAFFEAAMAIMANIPVVNARILIHDSARVGLKPLYEKTGLPSRFYAAVRVAVDVIHETFMDGGEGDRTRYRNRVIERILTQCDALGADDLDYLLDKLSAAA